MSRRLWTAVAVVVAAVSLLPVAPAMANAGAHIRSSRSTHSAAKAASGSADDVAHRRTDLSLELVSRTFDSGANNWKIVAEATLSSNRICLPIAFNCIVAESQKPSNATLKDLQCMSPSWNHLLVFRNHCLKQVFFAGHDQKFRFTYTTDPGVISGNVELAVEFGRGFLPNVFQQLAEAKLTVNLDATLEVTKDCPSEIDSAASIACTIKVSNPSSGPAANVTLTDTPDGALLVGGTLTETGTSDWSCAALSCTVASLPAGTTTAFVYNGTAASTATGGDGSNAAQLAWTGGKDQVSDTVVIRGDQDVELKLDKTTAQADATPGGSVLWTITVTNAGGKAGAALPASNVVLNDTAPDLVKDLTLKFSSGEGTWKCVALTCTASSMPKGTATFTASGTVATDAVLDSAVINEAGVIWSNNILGPDFPITAGSVLAVVAGATTTTNPTAPTSVPATVPSGDLGDGEPLSIAG